ncbi:MAG: hypothetical protein SPG61_01940, partial [Arcanobacterium sp.]|nr:hypothetical protein [Arcanobacterium sp.]
LNLAIVDEAPYAATTVVNGAECSMPEVKMSVQDAEGNELVAPEYGMPGRVIGEGDAAKCSILVTVDEIAGKDAYKVVLTDASDAVVVESDVDAVNRNFITVDLKF